MSQRVILTLLITIGIVLGLVDAVDLCQQLRALPTPGPCSCPGVDSKMLCPDFEMYYEYNDSALLYIACKGKELQFNHTDPLSVDFSEISKLEVKSCVVNVPLKDTLDAIGIRDVRAVHFDSLTRFENPLPLSGLNLTKVEINVEHITLPNDGNLLPDSEQLEEFLLCYSDINSLPNNFLSDKSHLKSLYISGSKNLKNLPQVIPIPSLEKLYLDQNNISTITSEHFSLLSNLKILDLKQNPIKTIAEDAFKSNLELKRLHLQFDGPRLPEGIFRTLTMLTELKIVNGQLEHIQDDLFSNQKQLRTLDLSGNQLTVLQGSIFHRLNVLEHLEINDNHLNAISRNIFSMSNKLRNISLNRNQFTKIPAHPSDISPFNHLTFLEKIELESNSLTEIGSWANHATLAVLQLSYNSIRQLNINTIPRNLHHLNLAYNKIEHIDVDEETLVNRQDLLLSLEGNPLTSDCKLINFIQTVRKGSLKAHLSKQYENLNIDQLYCDLEPSLCPHECNSCRVIGPERQLVLNCSYKNLEKVPPIPPDIYRNSSSIVLDVRNNSIRLLPTTHSNPGFGLINTLLLDNNLLETWSVANLHSNLSMISLNNNALYNLDRRLVEFIMGLPNLKNLHLLNNHWPCHCKLAKQMHWLQSKIVNFTALTCDSGRKLTEFEESCENDMLAFVLISFIILTLIASGFAFYYRHHSSIKKWLFVNQLCLGCASEVDVDTDFQYDAFISYSHRDESFIAHELFWQKLVYAMPHRDVVQLQREQKAQRAEQHLRNSSLRESNRKREQLDLADIAL
ncbi:AAEL007618-PA [Aedes aegypti]|uniref:AAEL007618-PA n=1 Tax=Aedes aegypti TaxID=7159 RepID=Q171J7_AEDAE|nr:AAEL007618-PA [Aedes aegypti]